MKQMSIYKGIFYLEPRLFLDCSEVKKAWEKKAKVVSVTVT